MLKSVAWAVATAWALELRDRVQLALDPTDERSFEIAKSYEWIRIDLTARDHWTLPTQLQRFAALARAACTAWDLLTRCPGYSARENPSFWRRVFRAYHPSEKRSLRSPHSFSFFDCDAAGRTFPRVLLAVDCESIGDAEGVIRAFCAWEVGPEKETEMDRVRPQHWTQLQSALLSGKPSSPLVVAVQAQGRQIASQLAIAIEHVVETSGPSVVFDKLVVEKWDWTEASASSDALGTLLDHPRVSIPTVILELLGDNTKHHRELQTIFGLTSTCGEPRVSPLTSQLSVVRARFEDKEIRALLSSLPYSRRVDTLSFEWLVEANWDLTDYDWAWLGYAVFHPDAETSTWKRLKLSIGDIGDTKVDNFTRMALGNNLLAALPGDWGSYPRTSEAYHIATLGRDTPVFAKPDALTSTSTPVLTSLPAHTTVDICVTSCDLSAMPQLVCVVVAGLGLGWINKHAITTVVARPARKFAALSQLVVMGYSFTQPANDSFLRVLSLLGPNLTLLDASFCGFMKSQMLLRVLSCCPKLTSLNVAHDGALWSDDCILTPEEHACLPRLEQMELTTGWERPVYRGPSQHSLETVLRGLHTLRLCLYSQESDNNVALRTLLTRHHGLRYLHCISNPGTVDNVGSRQPTQTMNAIDKMITESNGATTVQELTHGHGPLPVRQRAAFLSVCGHMTTGEGKRSRTATVTVSAAALQKLDRGVVERIFGFASIPFERQLCFQYGLL